MACGVGSSGRAAPAGPPAANADPAGPCEPMAWPPYPDPREFPAERERLAELQATGMLGTASEARFDRITK